MWLEQYWLLVTPANQFQMPQCRQRPASGKVVSRQQQKGLVQSMIPTQWHHRDHHRADYCKGIDEHQTRIWKGEGLGWECQSCGMLTLTGWFHNKRKGRGMETGGWLCYLQSSLVTFRDGLSCTIATQNKQTAGHPKAGTAEPPCPV